jgi:hypothetical protein
VPRHEQSQQQRAQAQHRDIHGGVEIEIADAADQHIAGNQIEESPEHVDRRRRQPFTRRLGERALKRTSHHAADEMRNRVGEQGTAEEP